MPVQHSPDASGLVEHVADGCGPGWFRTMSGRCVPRRPPPPPPPPRYRRPPPPYGGPPPPPPPFGGPPPPPPGRW
ncbi:GCG_CRPN prefix-to-repeats domain-containing protein [Bradyrhizobium sp.]|uniref:GCG_CRPN prefix-to-repeats domain-containing protein n=1 Tax=Bradyrhizobium sp. TaxID=376 RepID=UPI0039E233FA